MQSADNLKDATVDKRGNIYLAGETDSTFSYVDIMTIKYSPNGDVRWMRRWTSDSSNYDVPSAITTDDLGNVYVTGVTFNLVSLFDYVTIKYDSNGIEKWVARYDSPWNDWDLATSLAVDQDGNVYVGGGSYSDIGFYDYLTVKYTGDGIEQWTQRSNNYAAYDDGIYALKLDTLNNVYVTGTAYSIYGSGDILTIKYDSDGNQRWASIYDGPAHFRDVAYQLTLDKYLNTIVTGYSRMQDGADEDIITLKYDTSGQEVWIARYDFVDLLDIGEDVIADSAGNIYVGGGSSSSLLIVDYCTIKYSSDGIEQWSRRENLGYTAIISSITLDNDQNVVVTGGSVESGQTNILTVKYDHSGSKVWQAVYDGPNHDLDLGQRIFFDKLGNIIIDRNYR